MFNNINVSHSFAPKVTWILRLTTGGVRDSYNLAIKHETLLWRALPNSDSISFLLICIFISRQVARVVLVDNKVNRLINRLTWIDLVTSTSWHSSSSSIISAGQNGGQSPLPCVTRIPPRPQSTSCWSLWQRLERRERRTRTDGNGITAVRFSWCNDRKRPRRLDRLGPSTCWPRAWSLSAARPRLLCYKNLKETKLHLWFRRGNCILGHFNS